MGNTDVPKQIGGYSKLSRHLLLLLFLAGLRPVLSAGEEPELYDNSDRLKVVITGPGYVTVGVPASVACEGNCLTCTYLMSLDGEAAQGQGNVLFFTVNHWVEAMTVTCTATANNTKVNATATEQLQVLAGPANVSITGSDLMNASTSYTYTCHAYCQPSCSYAWKIDDGAWIGGHGNTISVTPKERRSRVALTCKASNSVSRMFVSATQKIAVVSGPSEVQIRGPDSIDIAENHEFICTAECLPSCHYVLSVDSQSVRGNVIEMRVDHPLKSVSLKCEAQNTASKKTATAVKIIKMKGPDSNLSARPEETAAVLLMAFIVSAALLL